MKTWLLPGLMSLFITPLNAAPACQISSPEQQAALLELYTSEGCSSCPPTEAWLARLSEADYSPRQLIPIALHVDYWDDLGWKDPFAKAAFTQRQKHHAQRNHSKTIYTPQLVLNGKDLRPRSRLESELKATSMHAPLQINLSAQYANNHQITLTTQLSSTKGNTLDDTRLYIAIAENGLSSSVKAGENTGRTLLHSHVVRRMIGPLPAQAQTTTSLQIKPDWVRDQLELIAFAESSDGKLLQAVRLGLADAGCTMPSL